MYICICICIKLLHVCMLLFLQNVPQTHMLPAPMFVAAPKTDADAEMASKRRATADRAQQDAAERTRMELVARHAQENKSNGNSTITSSDGKEEPLYAIESLDVTLRTNGLSAQANGESALYNNVSSGYLDVTE